MAQGELERARQNLPLEINRNHLQAVVGRLKRGIWILRRGCQDIQAHWSGAGKGFSTVRCNAPLDLGRCSGTDSFHSVYCAPKARVNLHLFKAWFMAIQVGIKGLATAFTTLYEIADEPNFV
jgi:hypothetical protein